MQTERSRAMLILPLLGGILLLAFLFSFIWGRYDVPFHEVPRILLNALLSPFSLGLSPTWTENMAVIVINIRLPRILLACLVGGCLSMRVSKPYGSPGYSGGLLRCLLWGGVGHFA